MGEFDYLLKTVKTVEKPVLKRSGRSCTGPQCGYRKLPAEAFDGNSKFCRVCNLIKRLSKSKKEHEAQKRKLEKLRASIEIESRRLKKIIARNQKHEERLRAASGDI